MLKDSGSAIRCLKRVGDADRSVQSGIRFLKVPVFLAGVELHRKRGLVMWILMGPSQAIRPFSMVPALA